jgi:hypothetical protein
MSDVINLGCCCRWRPPALNERFITVTGPNTTIGRPRGVVRDGRRSGKLEDFNPQLFALLGHPDRGGRTKSDQEEGTDPRNLIILCSR